MNIEITGETAKLIEAVIASGKYASVEEFITAMAAEWQRDHSPIADRTSPIMQHDITLASLLSQQGVKPCDHPEALKTDLWPHEATDEFLAFLKESRRDQCDLTERL